MHVRVKHVKVSAASYRLAYAQSGGCSGFGQSTGVRAAQL